MNTSKAPQNSNIFSVINENLNRSFCIIGFDIGHGTTSLAKSIFLRKSTSIASPTTLEIQNKPYQMTAIAFSENGAPIIGEDALIQYRNRQLTKVDEFEISFKKKPSESSQSEKKIISEFVKAVYQNVTNKPLSIQGEEEVKFFFIIGYPSGWSEDDKNVYEQIMSESDLRGYVFAVKESRAASVRAYKSKNFTIEQLEEPILVVDIGSSTTDLTFVYKLRAEDYGASELGSSLIDKAILEYCINQSENGNQLKNRFKKYPPDKKYCEIQCRKVKEEYFRNPENYNHPQTFASHLERLTNEDQLLFEIKLNQQIMEEILNTPLTGLGNKSWKEAFREQLEIAKQRFDALNIKPSGIILTGGASRMDFVKTMCEEVFPHLKSQNSSSSEKQMVVLGSEPELYIAKGLAEYGQLCVSIVKFDQEIQDFSKPKLENNRNFKSLEEIIEDKLDSLLNNVTIKITEIFIKDVLKLYLRKWRNREIKTINDLENQLKSKVETFVKKDLQVKENILDSVENWIKEIEKAVNHETRLIALSYGLQPNTIVLSDEGAASLNYAQISQNINLSDKLIDQDIENIAKSITNSVSYIASSMIFFVIIAVIQVTFEFVLAGLGAVVVQILVKRFGIGIFKQILKNKNHSLEERQNLLPDTKLESFVKETQSNLKEEIKKALSKQEDFKKEIVDVTRDGINKALEKQVEHAKLLLEFPTTSGES